MASKKIEISHIFLSDLPSTPQDLHVVRTDKGLVSLAWSPGKEDKNSPVQEYVLEIAPAGSGDFKEVATLDGKQCSYEVANLKDGQKYNFRIKARNQSGTSEGVVLDKPVVASPLGKGCLWQSDF